MGDPGQGTLDTREWLKRKGGAAKYWYVDPSVSNQPYNPVTQEGYDDAQGRDRELYDALNRLGMGMAPQGTTPENYSF